MLYLGFEPRTSRITDHGRSTPARFPQANIRGRPHRESNQVRLIERQTWAALDNEVSRADEDEMRREWSNAGKQGKREIPDKTRLPAAPSGTILTCENPGMARPGTEPGSHWWEAVATAILAGALLLEFEVRFQLTDEKIDGWLTDGRATDGSDGWLCAKLNLHEAEEYPSLTLDQCYSPPVICNLRCDARSTINTAALMREEGQLLHAATPTPRSQPKLGPRWCSGKTIRLTPWRIGLDSRRRGPPPPPPRAFACGNRITDDTADQRVFSGISRFPQLLRTGIAPYLSNTMSELTNFAHHVDEDIKIFFQITEDSFHSTTPYHSKTNGRTVLRIGKPARIKCGALGLPPKGNDTHKNPYDQEKWCRERKIYLKASERVNVDMEHRGNAKVKVNGRYSRKPADQRCRPARLPRAEIREWPRPEWNPVRLEESEYSSHCDNRGIF
ncbi:hypothetical protein PR048_024822 [Dryococelus australis]|uniref:Uncharacterized protein n=1 Tax=Dryococelus australis TaxID=614101 RepID=A0ABQ9GPP9_9NEOP|nr:hypothetical protein PR048_024822 [Dryococelus australis]